MRKCDWPGCNKEGSDYTGWVHAPTNGGSRFKIKGDFCPTHTVMLKQELDDINDSINRHEEILLKLLASATGAKVVDGWKR